MRYHEISVLLYIALTFKHILRPLRHVPSVASCVLGSEDLSLKCAAIGELLGDSLVCYSEPPIRRVFELEFMVTYVDVMVIYVDFIVIQSDFMVTQWNLMVTQWDLMVTQWDLMRSNGMKWLFTLW